MQSTTTAELPSLPPPPAVSSYHQLRRFADPHSGASVAHTRAATGTAEDMLLIDSATTRPFASTPVQGAMSSPCASCDGRLSATSSAARPVAPQTSPLWSAAAAGAALPAPVLAYDSPFAPATATATRPTAGMLDESSESQQTDCGDESTDKPCDSSTPSQSTVATPIPPVSEKAPAAPPTTFPGFTPLYHRVPMTRAQAYQRVAELQMRKLARHHHQHHQQQQQGASQRRPSAVSPTADDIARAFTPLYHRSVRTRPLPEPSDL